MPKRLVHTIITNLIRLILILTFIFTLNADRTLVQAVSAIALLITFIPNILQIFKIKIPAAAEILYLMFIYGLLILGEVRGFYHGQIWWDILMTFTASLALGFAALSLVYVLHKTNRINTNPILAALIIFSITLSLATLWELFEFTLDLIISSGLQKSLLDTMQDLSINLIGAILISIAGYKMIQTKNPILASNFLVKAIEKNSKLLGSKRKTTSPTQIIQDILKIGETSKIEFKSTLRKNLYINQFDKKIEHSALKTITAFLNTSGGHLLIGANDNGEILGLESDNFPNNDRARLYLTNMIKSHIGNEFVPFIRFTIRQVQNKSILLISCAPSKSPVFLKAEDKEEFYVRNGPSSTKIEGSALIEYINHRFPKE
ncbi:ATP-binding protein [Methanococcoides sp. SA1]|nr:ATP-binding protein [Methanococcoides sp. SA1]